MRNRECLVGNGEFRSKKDKSCDDEEDNDHANPSAWHDRAT